MISFCITVKNRSKVEIDGNHLFLFPECIKAIVQACGEIIEGEIIVSDWHSDDLPLIDWLIDAAHPLPVNIIQVDGHFNRGKGLNIAGTKANGDILFFLDADCLVSRNLIEKSIEYVISNKAFFPIVFSYDSMEHKSGSWTYFGYGNCVISKQLFKAVNGWPEYTVWGKEDDDFYEKISEKVEVIREKIPGFYHQWHPDDIIWKNRFSEKAQDIAFEINQSKIAIEELESLAPLNSSFILIDDARINRDNFSNRLAYPFLENAGEYAGPPATSEIAIQELIRLKQNGAVLLAFAWMAFWWMDYYPDLINYLKDNFNCVLKNERVVVFDLRCQLKS